MIEYPKIETVFNRDVNGTKKLIDGDYRNETVKFLAGNTWEFTEKIDGTNTSIVWDGHEVTYHGRTENAQIPNLLVNSLISIFGGMETEELFEQKFGDMPVILFGEGYGKKIQGCGSLYRPNDTSFILFDVFLPNTGIWLKRESVEDIAKAFGIDAVPIVLTGTIQDGVAFVKKGPKSTIGTAEMEGVVGRPMVEMRDRMGNRVIVKIKVKDFEQEAPT